MHLTSYISELGFAHKIALLFFTSIVSDLRSIHILQV